MVIFFLSLLLLLFPQNIHAIYDPTSRPNNKYGMHIVDFNDVADVATLVNSSGGDWGYITLVLSDNDRDRGKWQSLFDLMRKKHLIPIVRIATHVEGESWAKPVPDTFDELVSLLNSLNWPVKNRYVVIYNEPNHAKEWGGNLDPEGYGQILMDLGKKFKTANDDFFILPAGLDVSAASDHYSMSASEFLRRLIQAKPDIGDVIDGWNSHSYPNPGFSGSPYARGRGTLTSFDWELSYLQSLGITKKLPVFITETGWEHNQGKSPHSGGLSPEQISTYFQISQDSVWKDDRIVAITPFLFNYQDVPFDTFSWKRMGGGGFYPFYDTFFRHPKEKGKPKQQESYEFLDELLPSTLVAGSRYSFHASLQNIGQGIYSEKNGYSFTLESSKETFPFYINSLTDLEPSQQQQVYIHLTTPTAPGTYRLQLFIQHDEEKVPVYTTDLHIVPPPSIEIDVQFGWRTNNSMDDITALIYDKDTLIHKEATLSAKNGRVTIRQVTNILPDNTYRVVLLAPHYLPRQIIAQLSSGTTKLRMKRFYPIDFNEDGKYTIADIWTLLLKPPHDIVSLFVGR